MALLASFLLGFSKAGLKGIAVLHVTLMALAFGAKASTGLLVPLLIFGDIFAVSYYNKHANWKYIRKLLPWIVIGVLIGVYLGNEIDPVTFKSAMVAIILFSVSMMIWWETKPQGKVPQNWSFAGSMGILAGITTMIGNLAGVFSNVYFLAMRLPKNEFIGTAAWLFFIINLFKLPFHVLVWKTITPETLLNDILLLPALLAGLLLGVRVVHYISDGAYRKLVMVLTILGAILVLVK